MIYTAEYISPIGELLLAAKDDALTGLWIKGQKYFLSAVNEDLKENNTLPVLKSAKIWLDKYFAGKKPKISELTLNPQGSDFSKTVWAILCKIPYGQTTTYGQIAKVIANQRNCEGCAQAVGRAIGRNPISIIIPCHRVIGADGNLTGYAGGIDNKIKLLTLENVDVSKLRFSKS